MATGFQYREEAYNAHSDCASQGNCPNQTWGGIANGPAGNPLLTPLAAAIRLLTRRSQRLIAAGRKHLAL